MISTSLYLLLVYQTQWIDNESTRIDANADADRRCFPDTNRQTVPIRTLPPLPRGVCDDSDRQIVPGGSNRATRARTNIPVLG